MPVSSTLAGFFPPPLLRILAAALPIAIVCYFVAGMRDRPLTADSLAPEATTARLQPVAVLALASAAPAAQAGADQKKGEAVFSETCNACHGEGIAGAPKFGDKAAWRPRIAQGFKVLVKHAVEGFTGKAGMMPPKGGGDYSDTEIARAVAYMANKAGASFAEPRGASAK